MKYQTVLLTDNVELANLSIDAEEAKIQKIELPAFVAEEEPRERVLGLITDEPRHDRHHRDHDGHDGGEQAEAAPQSESAPEGAGEAKDASVKADAGGSAKPDESN